MLTRLRLLAEEDASKTDSPSSSKLNNCPAATEFEPTTLIDTIVRRARLAELRIVVAQSSGGSVFPNTGTHEDAPQTWNKVACEILEIGESQRTAQWRLIKDSTVASAATKSRALEIFTA